MDFSLDCTLHSILSHCVITFWNSHRWTICANGDKNGANADPLAPMEMDLMVPMVHPIAIGANDDHQMAPMARIPNLYDTFTQISQFQVDQPCKLADHLAV